jgi:hypothetical protein
MARTVKNGLRTQAQRRAGSVSRAAEQVVTTRISSKHQVTIAKRPFAEAGFQPGEVVAVRSLGPGRVELSSLDALFEKHRGRLATGGALRRLIAELRAQWD